MTSDPNPAAGDELLPAANMVFDHRASLDASPEQVWLWPDYGGRHDWLEVASLTPPHALVYRAERRGRPFTWALTLRSTRSGQTELRLRFRGHIRSTGLRRHLILATGGFFDRPTGALMIRGLQSDWSTTHAQMALSLRQPLVGAAYSADGTLAAFHDDHPALASRGFGARRKRDPRGASQAAAAAPSASGALTGDQGRSSARRRERVLGIGGHFMRAADPGTLGAWYHDCLGLDIDANGAWRQDDGPTVFATFEEDSDYFGSPGQQTMLNFPIRDLDAMLAQLRAKGANVTRVGVKVRPAAN